jgi:hypothetical protein
MGGRTSGSHLAAGGEPGIHRHDGESTRAPSSRLAEIRDALLRRIAEEGEVPLSRPPARWPLTREHATALIESFAREGLVAISRDGAGSVARMARGMPRPESGDLDAP